MSDSQDSSETTASTGSHEGSGSGGSVDTADATESKSLIEKAMDRAQEQLNSDGDTDGKRQSGDSLSSKKQAADSSVSDSTSTHDLDTSGSGEDDGTSDLASNTSDDSTLESVTPPDSWPKDRQAEFSKLPDEGKQLLMSIHKDMERGLKQSFDKLANERKNLTDRFGLQEDQLRDLAGRVRTFQDNPVAIISQLAEEAGIDVFFKEENPTPPEFDNQADLVKWLQEQGRKEARQVAADEAKKLRQQQEQEAIKARSQQEFEQAQKDHHDLAEHQEAIAQYISQFNLPIEHAYRLATYEGLAKLAQDGQRNRAELDKVREELEKLQKLSTRPPGLTDGQTKSVNANGLDMYEKAFKSAQDIIRRQE